jgi:CRP-like cAMP-binding protein
VLVDDPPLRVLEVDPDLGIDLEPHEFDRVRQSLVARTMDLEPGPWSPPTDAESRHGHLGLLVVDGLLGRTVAVERRQFMELLGPGDLLRPWDRHGAFSNVPSRASWEVLEEARLAVLDARVAAAVSRWPGLVAGIVGRTMDRARGLAIHLAICHMTRVEDRVLIVLWHFADRWGRVGPHGVVVPVRLRHHDLARIVGARRPSVSTALSALARQGRVTRRADGSWLLHGDPPEGLHRLRSETRG